MFIGNGYLCFTSALPQTILNTKYEDKRHNINMCKIQETGKVQEPVINMTSIKSHQRHTDPALKW